ncbi:MAG: hypothetical protein RBU30_24890 [Polyangia bacterium]|nr:hypothetical protein [Polyangia bacterium]
MRHPAPSALRPWPAPLARGLAPALFLVALLPACPARESTPRQTLQAYVAALEAKDYSRAYSLMSSAFQKEYDREEFVGQHRQQAGEVGRNLKELKQSPAKLIIKGELTYGDGERMLLVQEEGIWKLALDPVSLYSQRTPREALRSFVRALERQRHDVLLRFVPLRWRKVMTVEDMRRLFDKKQIEATRQLIKNIKANLDNKIEIKGDEAEMLYGDSYKVQFQREEGVWKIVDAD